MAYAIDMVIDVSAGQPEVNQHLSECLEPEATQFAGQHMAIGFAGPLDDGAEAELLVC